MSLRKILETFIRFFPSSFNRKYVHTVACTVVFVGPARFVFNPFSAVPTKTMVMRSLDTISTIACKEPSCVEVLNSFYGRFFVKEGQFINSKSLYIVPPLRPPFFSFVDSASLWHVES